MKPLSFEGVWQLSVYLSVLALIGEEGAGPERCKSLSSASPTKPWQGSPNPL